MRWILSLLLCAGLCCGEEFATKADKYVSDFFARGVFMGTVLVARNGEPVFVKSYGWANAEWDIPNARDTKYRLGSITKQFTAVAILQLVEQGKLKLDDPVSKYFEAPASWAPITIRHLLTHTSGIPSYTSLPGFMNSKVMLSMLPAEIVNLSRDLPLEFKPGERHVYNNTGYVFLGHILERVADMKYEDYLRKHVLDPAGMKDTGYDTFTKVIKRRATGYAGSVSKLRNSRYIDMSLPHAAGALYSTVEDLLRWDAALHGGKLIGAASLKQMTTPFKGNYGFGLVMDKVGARRRIAHGGGIFGFNTMLARYPDDKLTVIVLGNLEGRAPFEIETGLGKLAAAN